GLGAILLGAAEVGGQNGKKERDIFDYEAQKTAKNVKKIVFVADTASHGARGNHEFVAAAMYFARKINADYPGAYAVVHLYTKGKNEFPKDLRHADTIVVLLNHAGPVVNDEFQA